MGKFAQRILLTVAMCFSCALPAQQLPSNKSVQLIASAASTAATVNSADQINNQWVNVEVVINVSAYTSGQYVPHVQALDPFTGNYYDLLVGAAINGTGTTILIIGKGVTPVTNLASAYPLPQTWRLQMIGTATPSMTFSATANMGI